MEYCSRDRKGQEKKLFSPAANLVGEKELEQSNMNDFITTFLGIFLWNLRKMQFEKNENNVNVLLM